MISEVTRINSCLEGEVEHSGRPYGVPGVLPGDRVTFSLLGHGRRRRVRVESVEHGNGGGHERQQSFCPQFGRCGGCRGQHLLYDDQFRLKANPYIEKMKEDFGLPVSAILPPDERRYRNRMDFVVESGIVGLRSAGSYRGFVDVPGCAIQRERADAVLSLVRDLLARYLPAAFIRRGGSGVLKYVTIREGESSGAVILTLCEGREEDPVYRKFEHALAEELDRTEEATGYCFSLIECSARPLSEVSAVPGGRALRGDLFFEERMGPLAFQVPYDSFFQPNPRGFFQLFEKAIEAIQDRGLWRPGPILDLYCGSATLSLLAFEMLPDVRSLQGADFSSSGIAVGIRNIERYQKETGHTFPFHLEARDLNSGNMDFSPSSLLILDPPRAGLSSGLIEWLRESRPAPVLLSIACSPMTQLENLKSLSPAYTPVFAAVTDPFPQTVHLESAVVLEARG